MQRVLLLVIYVGIGIMIQKRKMVSRDFDSQLNHLYNDIILPCMIFDSLQMTFDPSDLRNCALLILLAIGYFGFSAILGQIAYRILRDDLGRIVRFGLIFTNFTLMGFPLVKTLFGDHTLFYFVVFLIPIRFVFYSASKPMLSPPSSEFHHTPWKKVVKSYFSPVMVAVFVGLIFYFCQWSLPGVLGEVVSGLGDTASVLGMLTCGMILGKQPLTKLLRPRYLTISFFRLLVFPAIFYLLLLPVPLSAELKAVVVICAALPVATMTASFTLRYNPNPEAQFDAAGAVLISHILSVLTIPIWANLVG